MKNTVWLLCFILAPAFVQAQEADKQNEFSIWAQIRPRAEYRNGSLTPRSEGETPATFINNRARLSLEYKRQGLSMKMSAQHVGVWGQDPQIDKEGRFILNEAWAKLDFGQYFFVQLGRQTLSYDDERILGGLDWNVAGRYHDALKLGYENKNNKLHLIFALNRNDETPIGGTYYKPGGQPYKNMQTVWYHYKANQQPFNASLLFINLGLETGDKETQKSHTRYLQTMGTYLTYNPSDWNLSGTFYYQTGKNVNNLSVSAFMWNLKAQYNFSKQWSAFLATDYLSGNKPGSDKFKAFDPLYGTHHKFYGGMDYFYASSFAKGFNPGLWDNQLGIAFKPSSKVGLSLNYHYFSTTAKVIKEDASYKKGLGSEFDFQVDWTLMKDVKLSAGYSVMAGTETMDIVKGGNHKCWQDWGWLSVNINPRILFVKW